MTRRRYIYCAIPLFTLLGCGTSLVHLLGATAALIVGVALALPAWGLVWARLYDSRRLRPEFAVLSVLPQLIFFLLVFAGHTAQNNAFSAPLWQNLYFLLTLAAMAVQMVSLRPGSQDEQLRSAQDPPFIFLSLLIVANGFISWVQYASAIFPVN